jgi:hypothetical protein
MDPDNIAERDGVTVVGKGDYWSFCPTCYRRGNPPNGDGDVVLFRSDDSNDVKRESRDHREWNIDHRPVARGPDNERIYG